MTIKLGVFQTVCVCVYVIWVPAADYFRFSC